MTVSVAAIFSVSVERYILNRSRTQAGAIASALNI